MIIESLKYLIYTLMVILFTIVAIPFVLIGELFYLLISLFGATAGIPFTLVKYFCKPISQVAYLRLQSLENAFINKLSEMNKFEDTDEDEINEESRME